MGNECYITPNLLQYVEEKEGSTLNDTNYVLVELPMGEYLMYTEEVLFDLQLKGYRPILAHPERYGFFREDLNKLGELVKKGIYTQMNLPSLSGQYGKKVQKAAKTLVEHQLIHFAGRDSHSDRRRSPKVQEAIEELKKMIRKKNWSRWRVGVQ